MKSFALNCFCIILLFFNNSTIYLIDRPPELHSLFVVLVSGLHTRLHVEVEIHLSFSLDR